MTNTLQGFSFYFLLFQKGKYKPSNSYKENAAQEKDQIDTKKENCKLNFLYKFQNNKDIYNFYIFIENVLILGIVITIILD